MERLRRFWDRRWHWVLLALAGLVTEALIQGARTRGYLPPEGFFRKEWPRRGPQASHPEADHGDDEEAFPP